MPLLPGPLWPGVVVPAKGPTYGLNRSPQYQRVDVVKTTEGMCSRTPWSAPPRPRRSFTSEDIVTDVKTEFDKKSILTCWHN